MQPTSTSDLEAILLKLYEEDLPGLAVGVSDAAHARRAIHAIVVRARAEVPNAYRDLKVLMSSSPKEIYLLRHAKEDQPTDGQP